MKSIIYTFLLFIMCAFINACNSDEVYAELTPNELDVVVLHYDDYSNNSFATKETKVIHSQYNYETTLTQYSNDLPEQLNFSEGLVLIVGMGKRPTSGFWLNLISVTEESNYNVANVVLNRLDDNCLVLQSATSPFQIVWIPSVKELLIRETLVIHECE